MNNSIKQNLLSMENMGRININKQIVVTLTPEFHLEQAIIDKGIKRPASIRNLTINGTLYSADFHLK